MSSRRSPSFALALVFALSGAACTNVAHTEPGDQPGDAGAPTALGDGLRIIQMNLPEAGFAKTDGGIEQNVYSTGVTFLVKDNYAETTASSAVGSIYVQDFQMPGKPLPPYSGLQLYKATYEPGSLVLAAGDVVDLRGEYERYFSPAPGLQFYQPQMYEPVVTFRFDYSPPTPTVIDISELTITATAPTIGDKWLSMLVTVENLPPLPPLVPGGTNWAPYGSSHPGGCQVYLTANMGGGGPAIDNELFDLPCASSMYNPEDGGVLQFKSVTGIVTNYGNYRVSPRSAADIVLGP